MPHHLYEIRPRKDHRGVDLISDALPFGQPVVWRAKRNQQRSQLRRRRALRKGVEKPRQTQGLNQKSPTNEKAIHSLLRGTDGGCPLCFGQATRSPSAKSDAQETAISDLEISAWEAYKGKQADALKKYYATDYCGVYAEGFKTVDKEVADMEKTDLRDYSLADTKVAFPEAKVAVITYKVTMHSTFAGQDTSGTYNSASVWIKRSGKWLTVFHTEAKAQ